MNEKDCYTLKDILHTISNPAFFALVIMILLLFAGQFVLCALLGFMWAMIEYKEGDGKK